MKLISLLYPTKKYNQLYKSQNSCKMVWKGDAGLLFQEIHCVVYDGEASLGQQIVKWLL